VGASGNAIRAGKAYYEIGGKLDPLTKALALSKTMVKRSVDGTVRAYSGAKAILGKAGISAALGAASAAIASILPAAALRKWAETGQELVNAARRAQVTTTQFQSLAYAAKQTGSSAGEMEGALKGIRDKIMEAARGSDEAQIAFAKLGLDFRDLARMTPDQQLRKVAAALRNIQNPYFRVAAAQGVLGNADFLPTLDQLDKMEARAKRLGITMSAADVAAANSFGQSLNDLWSVLTSVGNTIAAKVAPEVEGLVQQAIEVAGATRDWIRDNLNLETGAITLWETLKALWKSGTEYLGQKWDEIKAAGQSLWIDVVAQVETTAAKVTEFAGSIKAELEGWKGPLMDFLSGFRELVEMAKELMSDMREMKDTWGTLGQIWENTTPAGWGLKWLRQRGKDRREQDSVAVNAAKVPIARPAAPGNRANVAADIEKRRLAAQAALQKPPAGDGFWDSMKSAWEAIKNNLGNKKEPAELSDAEKVILQGANAKGRAIKKLDIPDFSAGLPSVRYDIKGFGARDVRTTEGLSAVIDSLKQQNDPQLGVLRNAYDLQQQQLVEQRRNRQAIEKITVRDF
jgi:hypothetical protein